MLFTLDSGLEDFYTEKYYNTEYLVQSKDLYFKAKLFEANSSDTLLAIN